MIDPAPQLSDLREILDLPSPHVGQAKTNLSAIFYNVERIEFVPVFVLKARSELVHEVGVATVGTASVPYIVFRDRLYRRIVRPGGLCSLPDILNPACSLIAVEGFVPEDWWPDHPLAHFLSAWESEGIPPVYTKGLPGKIVRRKEPKRDWALNRAAVIAHDLLIVNGTPYKATHAPGIAITLGDRRLSKRTWLFETFYLPYSVYLPLPDWPLDLRVKGRQHTLPARSMMEPDAEGAVKQAMSTTLAATALTLYGVRRWLPKAFVADCRSAYEAALAAIDGDQYTSMFNALLELLARSKNEKLITYAKLLSQVDKVRIEMDPQWQEFIR